jgi:hypothetical protein
MCQETTYIETDVPKRGRGRPRTAAPQISEREKMRLEGTVYRCSLCGRPVRQLLRGKIKMMHYNCTMIMTLMRQLDARLQATKWEDREHISSFRGDWFALMNSWFNWKNQIKYAPGSDEEF